MCSGVILYGITVCVVHTGIFLYTDASGNVIGLCLSRTPVCVVLVCVLGCVFGCWVCRRIHLGGIVCVL